MTLARLALASLLASLLLPAASQAQDRPFIWWDAQRQAVAIDPFAADGWGLAPVDLDFDGEHAAAATVQRSRVTAGLGFTVDPGAFDTREIYCPGIDWRATLTLYGWADSIGSLAPVNQYVDTVTWLDFVVPVRATNRFEFTTDAWNVAAGLSTLYVRPLDSADAPVAVTRAVAEGAWYRVGAENPWLPLLLPAPPPPVEGSLKVTPRTLNLKSKGQWVTVRLTLPPGYPAETVDAGSLRLSLTSTELGPDGTPRQSIRHQSGPLQVTRDDGLMVKFNRSDLRTIVFPGEASLTLTGTFLDGTRFAATGTIAVIP